MATFVRKSATAQKAIIARSAELFWREPGTRRTLLVERADALAACMAERPEEAELERITAAIAA
jgi:hypothetical protein